MNQIAIAIKINERRMMIGAQWPTSRTLKSMARLTAAVSGGGIRRGL
jgi:hypothetical protein